MTSTDNGSPGRGLPNWPILLGAVLAILALVWCVTLLVVVKPQASASASDFSTIGRNADEIVLTSSEGKIVRWGDLNGAPRAVFFGFTHCPEICPVTISAVSAAMAEIGPEADQLRIDFVTVDPARDTPQVLRTYLGNVGPHFRGYAAETTELDKLVKSYRAAYYRTTLDDGGYTMDHTAILYLIDREGNVVDIVGYGTPPDRLEQQLRRLLERS